ncbi:MAG: hypothetical protein GVY29_00580 [Spirochaetes bacterium]|jgi:hypothetical protein|nr:hypothetical protein [Spirochaetota bacterium]
MKYAAPRAVVAASILLILTTFATTPATAQSYSLYGDISALAAYDYLPTAEREQALGAAVVLSGHHRLSFDSLDFSAIHSFTWLAGSYADAAITVGDGGGSGPNTASSSPPLVHHVDEAFAEIYLGTAATLRAGKHRMSWGTARTVTPSDSMHPDGSLPSATEGFIGLSAGVTASPSVVVEAGLAIDQALSGDRAFWRDLRYGGRASLFLLNTIELAPSLVFQEGATFRPGLGASANIGPFLAFAEGAAEFLNPYRYPEVDQAIPATSFTEAQDWEPAYLVAAGAEWSHFFGPVEASLTAEYLFNGVGYTTAERQDLYNYVEVLRADGSVPPPVGIAGFLGGGASGAAAAGGSAARHPLGLPPLLGRHYALPQLSVGVAGYLTVTAAAAVNVTDGSVLGLQRVTVTPAGSLDISAFTNWATGSAYESEFGTFPGEALPPGRVRVGIDAVLHF